MEYIHWVFNWKEIKHIPIKTGRSTKIKYLSIELYLNSIEINLRANKQNWKRFLIFRLLTFKTLSSSKVKILMAIKAISIRPSSWKSLLKSQEIVNLEPNVIPNNPDPKRKRKELINTNIKKFIRKTLVILYFLNVINLYNIILLKNGNIAVKINSLFETIDNAEIIVMNK